MMLRSIAVFIAAVAITAGAHVAPSVIWTSSYYVQHPVQAPGFWGSTGSYFAVTPDATTWKIFDIKRGPNPVGNYTAENLVMSDGRILTVTESVSTGTCTNCISLYTVEGELLWRKPGTADLFGLFLGSRYAVTSAETHQNIWSVPKGKKIGEGHGLPCGSFGRDILFYSRPAIYYVNATCAAQNVTSGIELWNLPCSVIGGPDGVGNDTVLLFCLEDIKAPSGTALRSVDVFTGATKWITQLPTPDECQAMSVIDGDTVVLQCQAGDHTNWFGVNAFTGEVLPWRVHYGNEAFGQTTLINQKYFFQATMVNGAGNVTRYDKHGREAGVYQFTGCSVFYANFLTLGTSAVNDGLLFFGPDAQYKWYAIQF